MVFRHWTVWIWFVVPMVLCLAGVILWKSGRWLVHEDAFDRTRWAYVLAGESRDCERSDAAIRMFKEGRIDTLAVSATRVFKTRYMSEFMVDYYMQQGVPRDRLFEFRQDAYSTLEEARLLVRQFRLQNLDSVVIITSSYHTARTRRIFRKLSQGYPVILIASADYSVYDPNAWWSNRESLKTWFGEWAKTFYTFYELAKAPAETGKAEYQGLTPDVWSSRTPAEIPRASVAPVDTAVHPPVPKSDTAVPAALSDSGKEAAKAGLSAAESKAEAKAEKLAEADSMRAAKADSAKLRGDSLRVEAKPAPRDSLARKTLPKADKKPAAVKEAKKPAAPVKAVAKAADKKTEKEKEREREKAKARKKE